MELGLSSGEVSTHLMRHFRRIDELARLMDAPDAFPIAKGSPLFEDDRRSDPFQVSHSVRRLLHVAVDHLHAVRILVQGGQESGDPAEPVGALHVYADYTLIRGSLEAAAAGIWIISPTRRTQRITRSLRLMEQDAYDECQVG